MDLTHIGKTCEGQRLYENRQRTAHWNRWGPFLSERAWGTVREDYSPSCTAWDYFPHDHARSRAYRWNEDGLAGICDRHQHICFAIALWNGRDPILKERLFGAADASLYVKDAFHEYIVNGRRDAINPAQHGTKAAAHYQLHIAPGQRSRVRLRFTDQPWADHTDPLGEAFEQIFAPRQREAEEFYATVIPDTLSPDAKNVMRQALAGLLWSKQFYHYEVKRWLEGDPAQPAPPPQRGCDRGSGSLTTHAWTAMLVTSSTQRLSSQERRHSRRLTIRRNYEGHATSSRPRPEPLARQHHP